MNRLLSSTSFMFLVFILGMSSCKSAKKASGTSSNDATVENLVSKIDANAFHPEWFKAKAQLQFRENGRGLSFSSTIISKNDEFIWLNGKKFMIEGARILVTADSLFAIDKINKKFVSDNMDWVAREYELPSLLSEAISLEHLQDIFIGNPILDIIPYSTLATRETDALLTGEQDGYASQLVIDPQSLETRSFSFTQGENNMTVRYSDYRPVNDKHSIAYKRELLIERPGEGDIQLAIQYDNIVIDEPQSIKFSIPSNYSRM